MQRANISEFTPRNVQSLDERQHQVFGVKIQVVDPQGVFNAGMAAEVYYSAGMTHARGVDLLNRRYLAIASLALRVSRAWPCGLRKRWPH